DFVAIVRRARCLRFRCVEAGRSDPYAAVTSWSHPIVGVENEITEFAAAVPKKTEPLPPAKGFSILHRPHPTGGPVNFRLCLTLCNPAIESLAIEKLLKVLSFIGCRGKAGRDCERERGESHERSAHGSAPQSSREKVLRTNPIGLAKDSGIAGIGAHLR